jgi:hypothetical protein
MMPKKKSKPKTSINRPNNPVIMRASSEVANQLLLFVFFVAHRHLKITTIITNVPMMLKGMPGLKKGMPGGKNAVHLSVFGADITGASVTKPRFICLPEVIAKIMRFLQRLIIQEFLFEYPDNKHNS